ncbi:MAG: hypothetical protein PHG05_01970 [Candidatus Nanoarchaeia archaeon]|nr:hypothetical protein [Candidatus Nanoarchaeia archaeon]
MNSKGEIFPLKDILAFITFLLVLTFFAIDVSSSFKKGGDIDEKIIAKDIDRDFEIFVINLMNTKVEDKMMVDYIIENKEDEDKVIEKIDPLIKSYCGESKCGWKISIDDETIIQDNLDWNLYLDRISSELKYPGEGKIIKITFELRGDKLNV